MKTVFFIILFSAFARTAIYANTVVSDTSIIKKSKPFEKSILMGYDFQGRILIGFSGPQLLFTVNKNLKMGPAYLPMLWWDYRTGETDTKMGVGFRIDYKASVISFNTFRVGAIWLGSLVVGYKF